MDIGETRASGKQFVRHEGHPPFGENFGRFRDWAKLTVAHRSTVLGERVVVTTDSEADHQGIRA